MPSRDAIVVSEVMRIRGMQGARDDPFRWFKGTAAGRDWTRARWEQAQEECQQWRWG